MYLYTVKRGLCWKINWNFCYKKCSSFQSHRLIEQLSYISSKENFKADIESRRLELETEYSFYAFPHFSIILSLSKNWIWKIEGNPSGILVVSYWPAQPWFPISKSLSESKLMYFRPDINLLHSINREPHPIYKTLILVASMLLKRRSN